jgi:hypothetical protein
VAVACGQLHNLGTCPFKSVNTRTRTDTGTSSERKGRVSLHWGNRSDSPYSARCYGAVRSGNQVPVSYREMRRPHSRCMKVQTRIFILARNQARRHRVYSGNYPEHSSLPGTHETQKPSVSQGLTSPATSLIGFDN